MTPAAISSDARTATGTRGRGTAGSSTAGAGHDFDGVLTRLSDRTQDDDGADAQTLVVEDVARSLVASRGASDPSIISALVDRAAGAKETDTKAKGTGHDDGDDGSSSRASSQATLGFGLIGLPTGLPALVAGNAAPSTDSAHGEPASNVARAGPVAVPVKGAPKDTPSPDTGAADDVEAAGTTIRSVSLTTQLAPATSARATLARFTAAGKGEVGDAAERASAPTGKAETPGQDAAIPASTTIATIADAVSDLADASASTTSATPTALPTTTLAPARTMVLQLHPADLGTVAVRLHLAGGALDVQLAVSDPRTLGLVSRERDTLAARLDDRGYQLNALVIRGTDPSTSPTAASHDTSHKSADGDRDQGADGGRRSASGQSDRDTGRRTVEDRTRSGGDASLDSRRGLYI